MIMIYFRFFIIALVLTALSSPVYAISGTSPKGKINIDINNILTGLKTPNQIYLKAAKLEKEGEIKKALFLYTHLTEKYPDSDLAIKAMDRILLLEKESSSVQKASVAPAATPPPPTASPQVSSMVGKTVTFKEWFPYKTYDYLNGKYITDGFEITWTAVIEQELGDSFKVIINYGNVTGGNASKTKEVTIYCANLQNDGAGKTRVMSKSEITFK